MAYSQAKKAWARIGQHRWLYEAHGFGASFSRVLEHCAFSWVEHVQAIEGLRGPDSPVAPARLLEVRYEDFCDAPKAELGRICEFLDLSPDRMPRRLPRTVSSRNWKVADGTDPDDARMLERILADALAARGYR